jgi:hypothetical protein
VGEQPEVREARLRPEFAPLYPGVEPGAWQDAAALAEQMLTDHLLDPARAICSASECWPRRISSSGVGTPVSGPGLPARVVPIRRSSSACGRSGRPHPHRLVGACAQTLRLSLLAMQQASRTPQLPFLQLPAALPGIRS